jgi:hypothetical protein
MYFQLPLAMCFSGELPTFPVFSGLSVSFLVILMTSGEKRDFLLRFFWGNNQIPELAEWSQLDVSSLSNIISSPIFSSERLVQP